ncbi:uroporphyrinogen-III C-methyltransferase [Arenicella xantha]|uniref:Uncharacterized protein HemX n=1 Tax=Arenicella xantha TaxID=644221 RepID=A0A395JV56_9GAMM|nr:uroporphyrinogen-III C-methyltransferase [Arenicella xantha]RBP53438.1 uncharacterized protein HemX [Arenicella xantha]
MTDSSKQQSNKSKAATKAATVDASKKSDSAEASKATNTSESPQAATPQSAPQATPVVVKGAGAAKGLSVVAILLSLGALAGSGYTWYDNNVVRVQKNSDLAVSVTEIGGDVTRLGDAIVRLQTAQSNAVTEPQLMSQILQLNSSVDLQLRDLKQTQTVLSESVAKVNETMQKGVNSYVIDEVAQLLTLANNNVVFSGDVTSAIKALSLADAQLKSLADPRFAIVRQKINEEIGLLRNAEQIDIERMTGELSALAARVPNLKLENDRPTLEPVVLEPEIDAAQQKTVRGVLRQVWADVVNRFDIQRIDQPPKPLLAPEHRYFLNQNLQLQLAKAELAALQGRSTVYQQSLESALTWMTEYFDLNDSDVKQVMEQLTALRAQPIKVDLPPVTQSFELLQSIKGGQ